MKILIVDDEELIRQVLKEYLVLEGYQIYEAENGLKALDIVKENDIDFIIMDIMMPKMDGYQAVKEIKKIKNIPVLLLSARNEEFDKLLGFEIGVDDYVTKPFSPKEVVARIKAISKRNTTNKDVYFFDKLQIDNIAHEVKINNKLIMLTPKEYDLLKYFVSNPNIALTREQLLNNVWGYDFYGDDRTIDTHVKTLRQHLGTYGKYIKTIRKVGYKFEFKKED